MDDLSKLLINSGIGCFIDNVCFNHVFYADDLCLMAPCVTALLELLNICTSYSTCISVDVIFNPLKSFCIGFTTTLLKLSLPTININSAHITYTDSTNYLHVRFTFTNSHMDDNDILRQMRILYARFNKIVRLFHSCSSDVLLKLGSSFCGSFYCTHLWTCYKMSSFLKIYMSYIAKNDIPKLECLIRRDIYIVFFHY